MKVKNKCIYGFFLLIVAFFVSASVVQADETSEIVNNNLNNSVGQKTKNKKHKTTVYSYHQDKTVGRYAKYIHAKRPKTKAKAYIVLDRKTGEVLLGKNTKKRYLTASTGKLMTIYLARRKLARNPHDWQKKLKFSSSLVKMAKNPNLNCFHVKKGKKYTIKQIMSSAIIDSDNNSAIRLGQWVAGSNRKFITMMNKQAKLWHLSSDFVSASGLENSDLAPYGYYVKGTWSSGNLLSARDLAIIGYHVAHDYPSLMKFFATPEMYVAGQKLHNYNDTLPGRKYNVKSFKTDGMKTGWTPRSGYCFVGSCNKGNGRIVVVLHDKDEFSDANKLVKFTYKHRS
ncbi:D-alanyl-D-alanine carboxypeptidase [Lactobacillus sp. M0398]|uniref:serine hydrolase n=1 Tax=Lactobacillus TaxID=1578 RepID=UPI0018DE9CD3|nr:D-alanyl-D-alanine carboxypeptidase [Lactobacillus sp. M0398]MBI0123743.1 D-alanyl-D-alanine carboxypeptidase [Lactobacillus sp. W8174]MBI0135963.1 D-alanyl-D-alanine carboxypeptidase [Lactobacillus sp. W8173]